MISHWAHERAWYRCRHGYTSATPFEPGQHRTLYLREDRVLDMIIAALQADPFRESVSADRVQAYLRDRDMVAVCGAQTIVLEQYQVTESDGSCR
jgi:hypothetical protein